MEEQTKPDYDVIVVGAGLSGLTAAYALAKAGLSVIVLERGEYPGAKNLFGGVFFSTVLNKLIPNFWEEAPVERRVSRKRFSFLTDETEVGLDFRSEKFNRPPYNNSFTVLRAKFDRWFAEKAEAAGATIFAKVVVDDFIYKDGKVTGIKARGAKEGEYDELTANVVICAEGANSLLAEKSGLRIGKSKMTRHNRAVGVKEVISLPREVIEDRFNLAEGEGVAIEYFGDAVKNMMGSGFIYTNKDTISVGVGCTIEDVADNKIAMYDLLDHFKSKPTIRNLVKGGNVVEYSAHMVPEDSYGSLPEFIADGLILVGDAAGFGNSSLYHEITNLATASGLYAAETIIEANKTKDFSKKGLSLYNDKLKESFVLKDMKQFRNFVGFVCGHRQILTTYPKLFCDALIDYFTVSETPKSQVKKDVIWKSIKKINLFKAGFDALGAMRNMS